METMLLHMEEPGDSGVIYVTVGDTAFPEEGWFDLIHIDLQNWLPGLVSFARGHTDRCTLRFMDGPAAVRLTRQNGSVFVVCLWNHEAQIPQTEIDFPAFLDSAARSLRRYNRAMNQRGKPVLLETVQCVMRDILKNQP